MRVDYSRRSLADLHKISAWCRQTFGRRVAVALEVRIRSAVNQIVEAPESAPSVEGRPGVRVLSLVRYPYRIFYRVGRDAVTILHVRNTSRRPWEGTRG